MLITRSSMSNTKNAYCKLEHEAIFHLRKEIWF